MEFLKKTVVLVLTWEARAVLARYRPKIIAITGSVGKTTTKDGIYAVLSETLRVRKSQKSSNSEFGVPLTILGCETGWRNPFVWMLNICKGLWLIIFPHQYPQWLVLEVGADRPGDIRRIAKWLRPDIVVLTAVPEIPVHVEFFDSPQAVVREKRSLAEHIKPGGALIINGDDPRLEDLREKFTGTVVAFGMEGHNDYVGTAEEILYENDLPVGMHFHAQHDTSSASVSLYGALGRPRIYAALGALAVGGALEIDLVAAAALLAKWEPTPGRMRLLQGAHGSVIIDDTYNSSPAAALFALDTLCQIKNVKRRIALMGDMLELGRYASEAHAQVGARAATCADMLITVGFRSRAMGEAALDAGMNDENVREYELGEAERAGIELAPQLRAQDVVLVKGSQSMRMERAALALMAEPNRAEEFLVRQEDEWKDK